MAGILLASVVCSYFKGNLKLNLSNPFENKEHFAQQAILSECLDKPTFVFFGVEWCGYCKKAKPHWEKFMDEYSGKVNLLMVDCDKQKELGKKHGVQGYPTIRLYPNGLGDKDNHVPHKGPRTPDGFHGFLKKHMPDHASTQHPVAAKHPAPTHPAAHPAAHSGGHPAAHHAVHKAKVAHHAAHKAEAAHSGVHSGGHHVAAHKAVAPSASDDSVYASWVK